MLRRLFRVRKNTESFTYDLSKKIGFDAGQPKDYIFYNGEVILKPFEDFIKEHNLVIE